VASELALIVGLFGTGLRIDLFGQSGDQHAASGPDSNEQCRGGGLTPRNEARQPIGENDTEAEDREREVIGGELEQRGGPLLVSPATPQGHGRCRQG
jgi:hypothetical protein